jgi:kinesin family protein 5
MTATGTSIAISPMKTNDDSKTEKEEPSTPHSIDGQSVSVAVTAVPTQRQSMLPQPTQTKNPDGSGGNVRVFCRFRPLNERELNTTENEMCVTFKNETTCAVMGINTKTGQQEPINYTYDHCFDTNCRQQDVYNTAVLPIIESVLEGFNGTILAYGQTSSGKTHTMLGPDIDNEEQRGIIPRMVGGIFEKIETAPEEVEFTVKVSFIEIYNEKIRDLLDPKKNNLKVHESKEEGVYVKDMTESYVGGEDEVFSLLKVGNENRSIGATDMNKQSSRSHSCFILQIDQKNTSDFSSKCGKIYLVDLAGSERISKTGAAGETLTEAKNINKSLTTLGLVINALTDGKSTHVPYRDSKLTRILQESLGGNSKTSLIITCSPSIFNE